jgi:hypothetical protein
MTLGPKLFGLARVYCIGNYRMLLREEVAG